ncbi:HEPN domain-containing protein [Mariprofundus ferrooxydans]|uniref:HEPN domain-containing protein n=1 Tax=Mariprofundus ferrooxydans TaxID=314344 RepID=UPI00039BFD64|nr:HEPN domain-containing protein [Mariprofundus ferrooxydans]
MLGSRAVWPAPVLVPAAINLASEPTLSPAKMDSWSGAQLVFREDSFDPVSRVRRGRFYKQHGGQPNRNDWYVIIAPPVSAFSSEIDNRTPGLVKKSVFTYQSYKLTAQLNGLGGDQALIVLGQDEASTVWAIINVETIHSGEELVTLKARQSLGALPAVNWEKVPELSKSIVREKLDSLEHDFRKAGVESVVDRAREAATAILSAFLQAQGVVEAKGMDLGGLVNLLIERHGKHQNRIIACASEVPARLHSRAKHAEQEKRENLPPIREQDAELAVLCVGTVLRDIGWAEWR